MVLFGVREVGGGPIIAAGTGRGVIGIEVASLRYYSGRIRCCSRFGQGLFVQRLDGGRLVKRVIAGVLGESNNGKEYSVGGE